VKEKKIEIIFNAQTYAKFKIEIHKICFISNIQIKFQERSDFFLNPLYLIIFCEKLNTRFMRMI